MQSYRRYLEETPRTEMTPEAMRRLADLQIEKQFGIRGDGEIKEMAAPEEAGTAVASTTTSAATVRQPPSRTGTSRHAQRRSMQFRQPRGMPSRRRRPAPPASRRPPGRSRPSRSTTACSPNTRTTSTTTGWSTRRPGRTTSSGAPKRPWRRWISSSGLPALDALRRGAVQARRIPYAQEVPRRESAYQSIIAMGASSSYYELALYKQGWTLYKQEFYEEAQHRFIALSTTRSRSATTSNSSTTRTRNGESRTPSA